MQPFVPEELPLKNINWASFISIMGKANRAVANLNGVLYGIPNPAILLSPMTTQEAVLSSKIEGTQADFQDVLKFDAGETVEEESRKQDIHEIRNYRKALSRGIKLLEEKPFCLNSLLEMHGILLDSVRGSDKGRGYFRTIQNWIGTPDTPLKEAMFVPPAPMYLMDYLSAWEKYYHAEEPDPLVQLAIVHGQFEIIHPFIDGNGRMGRMIIPLFLYEKKLLSHPCFYLSAYFEAHRDEYVMKLRAIGNPGAWTDWILFFLTAIATQAEQNSNRAKAIQDLYEKLKAKMIDITHSQYAIPILDRMFERPVSRSSDFFDQPNMPSIPMVMTILGKLKKHGILKSLRQGSGRRAQILVLAELVNLCEGKEIF